MKAQRKHYTPEEKVVILRRHLDYADGAVAMPANADGAIRGGYSGALICP